MEDVPRRGKTVRAAIAIVKNTLRNKLLECVGSLGSQNTWESRILANKRTTVCRVVIRPSSFVYKKTVEAVSPAPSSSTPLCEPQADPSDQ